jgi:soluble calcium-activated nucleotidase 1
LNVFNGKVYSCDDHTGVVFELPLATANETHPINPQPWVILADGNGTSSKAFKCEWATLKDGDLWIGGHGVHSIDENGDFKDKNQKFVKRITEKGEVTHIDWSKNYDKIAEALDVDYPGTNPSFINE